MKASEYLDLWVKARPTIEGRTLFEDLAAGAPDRLCVQVRVGGLVQCALVNKVVFADQRGPDRFLVEGRLTGLQWVPGACVRACEGAGRCVCSLEGAHV